MTKALKDRVKEKMLEKKMSVLDLAEATGIPSSRIYKWYDKHKAANPKEGDSKTLLEWLESSKNNLEEVINESGPQKEGHQPILQVVLNLSYIGKKNADSIDKMADSNLLNAKSIATLVNLLANSDLASLLSPEQIGKHIPADNLPAEAFLTPGVGIGSSGQKHSTGKKKEAHR
jgi:hypothetical protein